MNLRTTSQLSTWESLLAQPSWLRAAAVVFGGSVLLALAAKVQIPVWPVPVTMQPFTVLLIGALLGSRRGTLAILVYLGQGLVGLPVFAMPPYGGAAYFLGPTAGYLYGFVLAAFVVGWMAERGWTERLITTLAAFAIGQGILLTTGFVWLYTITNATEAYAVGFAPFFFGEALKLTVAALLLPLVRRLLPTCAR